MEPETAIDEVGDDILLHIHECDRMYREIYGKCPEDPRNHACRKLMTMGFYLNLANMPELCIKHCGRWRIPGDEKAIKPPANIPVPSTELRIG